MQAPSLIEKHIGALFMERMTEMHDRIRRRMDDLRLTQREVAKATGLSTQRLGNYVQGTRKPDIETLPKIARALSVTTDWLLGVSETGPVDISPVVQRLLELDGLALDRAGAIASAVQEALRILTALPDEGDAVMRSRLAAQAAWQARGGSRLS